MLDRLIISNVALIDRLDIELSNGFHVLTGETGAGKSIIIDSVNLVLGERGSKELISSGKQRARVEAVFSYDANSAVNDLLEHFDLPTEDDALYVMREITASGKSLCRINGEIVPLNTLRAITECLVDVHGQHAHQSLLHPKHHIDVIDSFRSEKISPLRNKLEMLCKHRSEVVDKLNSGFVSEAERERRIDILSFQINEIEKSSLSLSEERSLSEELKVLANAEKINISLENGNSFVSGENGVLIYLRKAVDCLSKIAEFSEQYDEIYQRISELYYEIEDISYRIRDLNYEFEYSPERLDEVEARLDLINSIKRKYGGTVEAAINFMNEAKNELSDLLGSDEIRNKLIREKTELEDEYRIVEAELSSLRHESADELSELVTVQLRELGMKSAVFSTEFIRNDDQFSKNGRDFVEFMFTANAGEACRPLSKVASGGELSRIMLAIKTVCADSDGIPTLIFDEIDTGISGGTALKVGERMVAIAKKHQVLSITHLPQIAAFADSHMLVEKHSENGKTFTTMRILNDTERRIELARIMGSVNADESAVKYADELILNAEKLKHLS